VGRIRGAGAIFVPAAQANGGRIDRQEHMMREWGPLVLRTALGVIFIAHGLPKLLPLWGGGPSTTAAYFSSLALPTPYALALMVGVLEVGGGALLIVGYQALWVALAFLVHQAVAVWKVHLAHGFFLNWSLTPGLGHGYEFNRLIVAGLLCLALSGAGALSIDARRRRSAEEVALGRARLLSRKV
jgi:putative oxidoreductase